MRSILRVGAAFGAVALFVAGAHFLRISGSGAPDFPDRKITTQSPEVVVEIPEGATGSAIATILAQKQVVKSSEAAFRIFVGDPRSKKISPGAHRLTLEISAAQALEQLLDVSRMPNVVTIFEGEWNSEVIETLVKNGLKRADIARALSQAKLPAGFTSTEGLLFPAHYNFPTGTPISVMVKTMIDRALHELEITGISKGQGKFSPRELVTIASIIQQEGDEKDFGKISQVIRNRLAKGMRLQLDSTVHYIKKSRGSVFLSTQSTLLASPFNTYQRYGLPPSPIGNPGRVAMEAALKPTPGDWLFFITVKPGDTRFTSTLDEFNTWKREYKRNLAAGAFK